MTQASDPALQELPPDALALPVVTGGITVARRLLSMGYRAALVGGGIRDLLQGRVPKDMDLASDAPAEILLSRYPGARSTPRGLKHGTVVVPGPEGEVEITRFRADLSSNGRYSDVAPATLEEDLARRDFTVNAMALEVLPDGFRLLDPHGGLQDLRSKVLRTVGDPHQRFNEDRLRVLRAYRFRATHGLQFSHELSQALQAYPMRTLAELSGPRRWMEWRKLYSAALPGEPLRKTLMSMGDNSVFQAAWLGRKESPLRLDAGFRAAAEMAGKVSPAVSMAAIVAGLEDRSIPFDELMLTANEFEEYGLGMEVLCADQDEPWLQGEPAAIRRFVAHKIPPGFSMSSLLAVAKARRHHSRSPGWWARATIDDLNQATVGLVRSIHDLEISGQDVMDAGVSRGPGMGEVLRNMHLAVLEDPSLNERSKLLGLLERLRTETPATPRRSRPALK